MLINVEIKVIPFGRIRLEIGKPILAIEERQAIPALEAVHYREPQETASRIYEVQYAERLMNYIVPLSTG